jgi:hypothetical protein
MDSAFEVHMLNEDGKKKALAIATEFDNLLNNLFQIGMAGREAAIVITKLEEACFFAKKSMANQKENQNG